jgi:hypothetical protein
MYGVFSKRFHQLMMDKQAGSELLGSWTVEIGDQDEAGEYTHTPVGCLNKQII